MLIQKKSFKRKCLEVDHLYESFQNTLNLFFQRQHYVIMTPCVTTRSQGHTKVIHLSLRFRLGQCAPVLLVNPISRRLAERQKCCWCLSINYVILYLRVLALHAKANLRMQGFNLHVHVRSYLHVPVYIAFMMHK